MYYKLPSLARLRYVTLCAIASLTVVLTGCDGYYGTADGDRVIAPKTNRDARIESRGKLTGEDGWDLFGDDDDENEGGGGGIGVNGFLWRATLDTLSFMPIASADPFGGVILTDWYEDPNVPGERYKVNALILDTRLRADGVTVSAFKQRLIDGTWRDQAVANSVTRQLEDTILTRARELRIAQSK